MRSVEGDLAMIGDAFRDEAILRTAGGWSKGVVNAEQSAEGQAEDAQEERSVSKMAPARQQCEQADGKVAGKVQRMPVVVDKEGVLLLSEYNRESCCQATERGRK